jgi:D-3-phosphoglycerate dehydrogenase
MPPTAAKMDWQGGRKSHRGDYIIAVLTTAASDGVKGWRWNSAGCARDRRRSQADGVAGAQAEVLEVPLDDPRLNSALSRAQGLVVRTYTKVNDELLNKAPKLKVVGRGGVGLENIDVAACRKRGIQVVYTPDANTIAVGDFVFGYILQLIRPYAAFRERTPEPKEFKRLRDTLRGRQLNELTIGILGMGRVGRRVGHIAADGFGMRVLYNDVIDVSAQVTSGDFVDKPTLYRESDILAARDDAAGQ